MRPDFLLEAVSPVKVAGRLPESCAGLTHDSRRVTPGAVFFALPGQRTDGARHIADAVRHGASVVVAEPEPADMTGSVYLQVRDARRALAHASAAFYGHPARTLKLLGITGTNGKTTVAFLTQYLLEAAGLKSGMIGTVHYDLGARCVPAQRTTPDANDLPAMFAAMVAHDCHACVMEVSSHAIEQRRIEGLEFAAAAFTNLTRDHLDYHGDMAAYYQTKKKLFTHLAPGGRAVVSMDDPHGCRLADELENSELLTTSIDAPADVSAESLSLKATESTFMLRTPEGRWPCSLPLIGRFNVANALSALSLVHALGVSWRDSAEILNGAPAVPGRLEALRAGQPFSVFVDYAHTDDALRQVLATLRELSPARLLVAFGCGGNRDEGKRRAMGRAAAEGADVTIVTTDNPRAEDPATIAGQVEAGYRGVREDGCEVELDRERAIDEILRQAREGDTVLIAGKGHETVQEFAQGAVPFDDRQVASAVLAAMGHER